MYPTICKMCWPTEKKHPSDLKGASELATYDISAPINTREEDKREKRRGKAPNAKMTRHLGKIIMSNIRKCLYKYNAVFKRSKLDNKALDFEQSYTFLSPMKWNCSWERDRIDLILSHIFLATEMLVSLVCQFLETHITVGDDLEFLMIPAASFCLQSQLHLSKQDWPSFQLCKFLFLKEPVLALPSMHFTLVVWLATQFLQACPCRAVLP